MVFVLALLVLGLKVRVLLNTLQNAQELHALFLGGHTPALEPAFVEALDDLIQRVFLLIAAMHPARIGVGRIKLGFSVVQGNTVVELDPLQPITLRTASVAAARSLMAAGLGLPIQPDMSYRPRSLEGDIIEALPLIDLSEPLDVGLARRGRH